MKKTAKRAMSAPKKTKAKTKPKAKAKAKTANPKAKAAKSRVKARTKPQAPKKPKGLSIGELFQMKQEREQAVAQDAEAWKHKKDLPAHDAHHPEDPKDGGGGKKSGFGGARHH